jgi:hypothetical protein
MENTGLLGLKSQTVDSSSVLWVGLSPSEMEMNVMQKHSVVLSISGAGRGILFFLFIYFYADTYMQTSMDHH